MPDSLMVAKSCTKPIYEMKEGVLHITFRPQGAFVFVGRLKFEIEEGPAIVIGGRKVPVRGIC